MKPEQKTASALDMLATTLALSNSRLYSNPKEPCLFVEFTGKR